MEFDKQRFELDLEFGKIYEHKLTQLIDNDSHRIVQGYFPYYDVELTKNNVTLKYEVKADRVAYNTGQMSIEFECNNKNSGINVTQADYYAYYVVRPYNLFELYIIPVEVIKEKINLKQYKRIVIDKKSSRYIFSTGAFSQYKFNS